MLDSDFAQLLVGGLRGFSTTESLVFARPNGAPGSGLTVLVGSNNAGKSTLLESLFALSRLQAPSFTEGRRNQSFGDRVEIRLSTVSGASISVESLRPGGSETALAGNVRSDRLFIVPSRRAFAPFFGNIGADVPREQYVGNWRGQELRTPLMEGFAARLFRIDRDSAHRAEFQAVMAEIIDPPPEWAIDQSDGGQYYLRYRWKGPSGVISHNSEGLGDGLVSLLSMVDSLYDANPDSMVVIDEPELSLHPQLQKRVRSLLSRRASGLQIVVATHSPYFVSWSDVNNGATVVRVHKTPAGSRIAQPSAATLKTVGRFAQDLNNPHVLGLEASEVFFLEDHVLLVEGQEDVVVLPRVLDQLGASLPGTFFGWGVGGASKMDAFAGLLQEMGYASVVGILDGDMRAEAERLRAAYPAYRFLCIPAGDVRTKPAVAAREQVEGLVDERGVLRPEHTTGMLALLAEATGYLGHSPSETAP